MCNRMCDTVLLFLYAHLENKIITSNLPPPPPPPQHTATKCVSSGGKRGLSCPRPPSLEFEVQNNKSLCIIPIVLLKNAR